MILYHFYNSVFGVKIMFGGHLDDKSKMAAKINPGFKEFLDYDYVTQRLE